jgi:hypothetical protein
LEGIVSTRTTTELINDIAAELNEDAANIRVQDPIWSRYAQQGVTIRIHCKRPYFKTILTLSEMGIKPESEEEEKSLLKTISLGHRYFIPREWDAKGKSYDDAARQTLRTMAYDTHWGFWLHTSQYDNWRQEVEKVRAEFYAHAREVSERYDELRAEARLSYVGMASQAYNRLLATPAGREGRIPGFEDREQWIADSVNRMAASAPPQAEILDGYKMWWDVSVLPLQQNVAEDERRANKIRLDAATQAMLADLKATQARDAAGGIQQFVNEVQGQIRTYVYDATISCLEVLEKNDGRLGSNSTKQLKNLVQRCSEMVFWEDPDLETRVREIGALVDIPSAQRSPTAVRQALQQLGAASRLVLLELDQAPKRSGKGVGIPDDAETLESVVRRGTLVTDVFYGDDEDFDFEPVARRGESVAAAI